MNWQTCRLHHVRDGGSGIQRRRAGRSFVYLSAAGRRVGDRNALARIRSLAIPPAWKDVWICPDAGGHIQATGRDAKGRKQYRYHPRYRSQRDEVKFSRLVDFATRLPHLRQRVQRDMQSSILDRNKVLAVVTRLLETTCIRIGNSEYVRQNGSFGLTTLRDKHVRPRRKGLRLSFPGKSGVAHEIDVEDPKLAAIVRRCRDLPGYELFQYIDDTGQQCTIDSAMVNDYIREAMQGDFTAKDFRTWHGTIEAVVALGTVPLPKRENEITSAIRSAVNVVAKRLGNRAATCRKFYIHPSVLNAFAAGKLPTTMREHSRTLPKRGLSQLEKYVLTFLRRS